MIAIKPDWKMKIAETVTKYAVSRRKASPRGNHGELEIQQPLIDLIFMDLVNNPSVRTAQFSQAFTNIFLVPALLADSLI